MNLDEFIVKMHQIKDMGYVQTHRGHDTGIGKTLEDLLGITENNIAGPDFAIYELKSGRKNSSSMLTLFTKTPKPRGVIRELLRVFGYPHRKSNSKQQTLTREPIADINIPVDEKELHSTIDSRNYNSVGLKLALSDGELIIDNDKGVRAYWDEPLLKEAFTKKYDKMVYVLAENRGKRSTEQFWFNEAYLLEDFGFDTFTRLIDEGNIKVDLRIGHYPNGRLHDHGTAFRIFPKDLPMCFDTIKRLV